MSPHRSSLACLTRALLMGLLIFPAGLATAQYAISTDKGGTVTLINTDSLEVIGIQSVPDPLGCAITADQTRAYVSSDANFIQELELPSLRLRRTVPTTNPAGELVIDSASGLLLASGAGGPLAVFDIERGREVFGTMLLSAGIAQSGRFVLSQRFGIVNLVRYRPASRNSRLSNTGRTLLTGAEQDLEFAPGGKTAVAISSSVLILSPQRPQSNILASAQRLTAFKVPRMKVRSFVTPRGIKGQLTTVEFHESGNVLYALTDSGQVYSYDYDSARGKIGDFRWMQQARSPLNTGLGLDSLLVVGDRLLVLEGETHGMLVLDGLSGAELGRIRDYRLSPVNRGRDLCGPAR